MESQDTILSEELQKVYGFDKPQHLAGLEWQAAITAPIFFGEGRKAGIKEVVEFIKSNLDKIDKHVSEIRSDWTDPRYDCREIEKILGVIEYKLKEWGIKIGECDNVFS